jgi:DNA-binding NarL/FixJ family response regulator
MDVYTVTENDVGTSLVLESMGDHTAALSATRMRVLMVDDHPLFCDGLNALLERSGHFDVVGQARCSADALNLARITLPELILLDISLDNDTVNGLDLIHRLRRICPEVKIVVLTGHTEPEWVMNALRQGVNGFVEKGLPTAELLAALERVRRGERVLPDSSHLTLALTELGLVVQERERAQSGLTDQEIEMLRLAANGKNNKQIGDYEFFSEITVKRKMQVIYRKLSVTSRAQAVAEAIRLGFI